MKTRDKALRYESKSIGIILKQQRILLSLTLRELAAKSGVSASHLGRIEQGQRFPSAHTLFKITEPLKFKVEELLILAGYLSNRSSSDDKSEGNYRQKGQLDSTVAMILSQEPIEVQRTVLGILSTIKYLATSRALHE